MATVIYRGSTPTIYIRPTNGMHVDDLGDPSIVITQDLVLVYPDDVTIDSTNNRISVKLTEEDTLSLTEGVETLVQAIYESESGDIYRFPVHNISVASTLIEELNEVEEPIGETGEEA